MVSKKLGLLGVAMMVVFLFVFLALASTALASYDFATHTADHSMIADSSSTNRHNLAAANTNPCDYCHIPHGAQGDFLWELPPSQNPNGSQDTVGTADEGTTTDIKPLCYSCHDGTETSLGAATAFSSTHYNHRTRAASDITNPTTGATRGPGRDCDLCHDPHDNTIRNYLKQEYQTRVYDDNGDVVRTYNGADVLVGQPNYDLGTTKRRWSQTMVGGNFCASCHESNMPNGIRNVHPVYAAAGSTYSGLPFPGSSAVPGARPAISRWPIDRFYDPAGGDYNGTRVFDPVTGAPSGNTATANVMCESCHTPHGANADLDITGEYHILNTMTVTPVAQPPGSTPSFLNLCTSCH